ncbi:30S ribosomal protein S20 [Candidatus Saccharibacteria bacterium]|nr:30S ribosomal protein S20 [Candidatus Saccharibacteria bacterium]
MPIIKSAKKAARQAVKRTEHNQQIKRDIKTALKAFKENPTSDNLRKVQSEYDKAVKKNLLNKNTAARRKSALAKILKDAGGKVSAAPKKTTKPAAKATAKKPAAKKPAAKTTTKKPAAKKTK